MRDSDEVKLEAEDEEKISDGRGYSEDEWSSGESSLWRGGEKVRCADGR